MLNRILIGLGIFVVLFLAAFAYLNHRNRTLSPPGNATLEHDGMTVSVAYSKPSVRDRLIFGKEEEGALLPHGKFWRLGANEPTTLEISTDFTFGSNKVKAGKYTVYAIPEADKMLLKLNSDIKFWGVIEPDEANDVASVLLDMLAHEPTEQFHIQLEPIENGINIVFFWDAYYWEVPLLKES